MSEGPKSTPFTHFRGGMAKMLNKTKGLEAFATPPASIFPQDIFCEEHRSNTPCFTVMDGGQCEGTNCQVHTEIAGDMACDPSHGPTHGPGMAQDMTQDNHTTHYYTPLHKTTQQYTILHHTTPCSTNYTVSTTQEYHTILHHTTSYCTILHHTVCWCAKCCVCVGC